MTRALAAPILSLLLTLSLTAAPASARTEPAIEDFAGPALKTIMGDPTWIGDTPRDPVWSADGRWIYYEVALEGRDERDLFRLDPTTGESTRVADDARHLVEPAGRGRARGGLQAFIREGDLFVRAEGETEARQLTRTDAIEHAPTVLVGGKAVAFRRGDALVVRELDGGLEFEPLRVVAAEDPADDELGDDFYSRQQARLFDVLKEKRQRRESRLAAETLRRAADPTRAPRPFYLGADVEILDLSMAPNLERGLAILQPANADEGRADQMPVWVTEDGYVEVQDLRPKVGTGDDIGHELVWFDLVTGQRRTLDLSELPGIADDPLADLRAAAELHRTADGPSDETQPGRTEPPAATGTDTASDDSAADDSVPTDGDEPAAAENTEAPDARPRPVTVDDLAWSDDGRIALSLHSLDNKDRWTVLVELDGSLRMIERLTNVDGWINWSFNEVGFLPDGRLWFLSEATDRSQLLLNDGRETRRLSADRGVVSRPRATADGAWIYYTANTLAAPYDFHVYRVAPDGGEPQQVTTLGGRIEGYALSPDDSRLMLLRSQITRPQEIYVQAAEPGAPALQLTDSVSEAFAAVDWVVPEIVEVPSSVHDRPVWARLYLPRDRSRLRGADGAIPAVVFVHGAGYLHNAHAGWSVYFREFMFHTWLAERGYAVLDMDYRGSAGYGADWRTAIYRRMGHPEVEDLADGVSFLADQHDVDAARVGVYGGSYGGFLTMMALFRQPGLFAAGAALRPVTDWAHYNHPYTSNILNTPQIDPEAYERSSPIEFAGGLQDPLLIAAPMLDDNVFFLDVVRLTQRLIELEKVDWWVALYPVEPHSFRRPSSWLDEYRRIGELFEETLRP
ncbi:MAG: prolyl oligopeptidase family serine peptidase [Acidobacteriota bacterium]